MRRLLIPALGVLFVGVGLRCTCQKTPTGTDAGPDASQSDSDGSVTGDSGAPSTSADAGESVLMHHKTLDRNGMYIQPSLKKTAISTFNKDPNFSATLPDPNDNVYAQPLYVDRAAAGKADLVIVATEADNVYALDATTGAQVWVQNLGTPVPLASLPCGNIDPVGITGTPVIDPVTNTVFMDAEVLVNADGGNASEHLVFALVVDTGAIRSGWPVDVSAVATPTFDAAHQGERGALAVLGGVVYIPFGGRYGDCSPYRGRVIGISIANPTQVQNWATAASAGGAWAAGGVASDGTNLYVTTGNTQGASSWGGGEAIVRLTPGNFGSPSYWAPPNWLSLDNGDVDVGGSGPIVFDMNGSSPAQLVVALGKDGNAYLLDRNSLGGITGAIGSSGTRYETLHVASNEIINAAAVYTTPTATYVVARGAGAVCTRGAGGDVMALKVVGGSPPGLAGSWCATAGSGSPMVTTSDGTNDAIVWVMGADNDNRLHALDGDTGAPITFAGSTVTLANLRRFNTPIAAKGRIYVAGDGNVVAFKL